MTASLRWGIVGTGAIARRFARELTESRTGALVAVGSRTPARAQVFADDYGAERSYGDYQRLLDDDAVDAVYVATPHPDHARWAVRAADAGKHVLCEKPLAVHSSDAETIVDAARAGGVFLMEAFMYRCHPQTERLLDLLRSGVIGQLRVIEAVHSFHGAADLDGRLLNRALGGGGILDVGCYCMSGARLVAGIATGLGIAAEPLDVTGAAHIGPTGVDEWAVASLRFPGGVVAHLSCGVLVDQPPALRLYGSEGSLDLAAPWLPGADGGRRHEIVLRRPARDPETITVLSDRGLYAYEADEVAAAVSRGAVESEHMPWADTVGNMAALDRWRRAIALTYDLERPESLITPVRGRPLSVRPGSIPRGEIRGVAQPVSRAVIGTMLALGDPTWPTAMAVFDEFFERGGNAFDTARRYGEGESDRALGWWMESRGVRAETVVIAKGAHTPHCDPATIVRELTESLDDLRTERADLYFLHRDNPDVPIDEFVGVLNDLHRAGRMGAFGGSNWTMARIDAANDYAEAHGLVGFSAVSNQFSLARMVRPTFPGCLAASGPEWSLWLTRTGTPVVAWSSQAAGFFAVDDVAAAWDDADNLTRRDRARQLARQRGVPATTVALAWVLSQPLDVFPIIGPRDLAELRTSLEAFRVELTADELAWLQVT